VGLCALAAGCTKIKELKLEGTTKITDEGLKSLAENCKALQEITIQNCTEITSEGIKAFAEGCIDLKYADFTGCTGVDDAGWFELANWCCYIHTLNLASTNITDEGIKGFTNCKGLENLTLCGTQISNAGLSVLAPECRLSNVNLNHCENVDDSVIDTLVGSQIEQLDIAACPKVTEKGLKVICETFSGMEQFWINDSPQFSVEALMDIGNFGSLTLLNISYTKANVDCVKHYLENCDLEEVYWLGCEAITQEDITALQADYDSVNFYGPEEENNEEENVEEENKEEEEEEKKKNRKLKKS